MTRDQAGDRQAFEQFMLQRNATTRLARQSYALGGHYRTTTVQRAWEMWQAAVIHAFADPRIAELEAELAAEPRATDAPTAVAAADPQLLKFYGAASDAELIAAQAAHIKRLQAKLPPAPSFAPQRVREG